MSGPILVLLRTEEIAERIGVLKPFIEKVCSRSKGRYAPENIFGFAAVGEWQIWLIVEDGIVTFVGGTELITYPTGAKGLLIRFGTGRGRHLWQHRIDGVVHYARENGCIFVEGVFRRGWGRVLPGWTHNHDCLEMDLR